MDERRIREIVREEIRFAKNTTRNDDARALLVIEEGLKRSFTGDRAIPSISGHSGRAVDRTRKPSLSAAGFLLACKLAWSAFFRTLSTKPRHKPTCGTGGDPASCPCNTMRWTATDCGEGL